MLVFRYKSNGADSLIGGAGNDTLGGGDVADTALYAGALADYRVEAIAGGLRITDLRTNSPDGTDIVREVEFFSFAYAFYTEADLRAAANRAPVAVDDAPAAAADAYATTAGRALTVAAAAGVLANDADVDAGDALGAALVQGPASGALGLNPDGSFTYTPARGFLGTDSFTYRATDAAGATSATTTVSIDVLAGKAVTPPVAPPVGGPRAVHLTAGDDRFAGTSVADTVYGLGGNDSLDGGAGQDRVMGGAGDDLLTGGPDTDTFVFRKGEGSDIVTDFDRDGDDVVELAGLGKALDSYAEVLPHLSEVDSSAVLDLSAAVGLKITFQGTTLSQIGADDFVFA